MKIYFLSFFINFATAFSSIDNLPEIIYPSTITIILDEMITFTNKSHLFIWLI